MPANLVFRRKIWGARDNGIPPRSTPEYHTEGVALITNSRLEKALLEWKPLGLGARLLNLKARFNLK